MNDEEVKQLLRELAEKADKQGKSESVRIFLDPKPKEEEPRKRRGKSASRREDPEEPEDMKKEKITFSDDREASGSFPENRRRKADRTAAAEINKRTVKKERTERFPEAPKMTIPEEKDDDYYLDEEDDSGWDDFSITPKDGKVYTPHTGNEKAETGEGSENSEKAGTGTLEDESGSENGRETPGLIKKFKDYFGFGKSSDEDEPENEPDGAPEESGDVPEDDAQSESWEDEPEDFDESTESFRETDEEIPQIKSSRYPEKTEPEEKSGPVFEPTDFESDADEFRSSPDIGKKERPLRADRTERRGFSFRRLSLFRKADKESGTEANGTAAGKVPADASSKEPEKEDRNPMPAKSTGNLDGTPGKAGARISKKAAQEPGEDGTPISEKAAQEPGEDGTPISEKAAQEPGKDGTPISEKAVQEPGKGGTPISEKAVQELEKTGAQISEKAVQEPEKTGAYISEEAAPEPGEDGIPGSEEDYEEPGNESPGKKAEKTKKKAASGLKDKFSEWKKKHLSGSILIFAGIVLLAVIIIVAAAVHVASNRHKSRNVTADEGLSVLVEKEPSSWTNQSEVKLKIRADSDIQSVTINGEDMNYSGGKSAVITAQASDSLLNVSVKTQEKELKAQVGIPMIDSKPPELNVSINGSEATLTAADDQSGLAGIYYGTLEGLTNLPLYQPYTGPFEVDSSRLYCYYAIDKAGNMTTPTPTRMVEAQSLSFDRDSIALFPGETALLKTVIEPENAYINGLTVTNSNEDVARIDASGLITAIADGTTTIEASADGMPAVSCTVKVQSEADITVSAVGDITLGTDVNFSANSSFDTVYATNGASYFFDNVRDILSSDSLTFGNLEGTLSAQGTREDKTYAFRGDPSYTAILQDGSVEAVTLANNHSSDYGDVSHTDTQQYLTDAGITWVEGNTISVREVNGVSVGLIGIYALDREKEAASEVSSAIQEAKDEGANVIIVYFHWGTESATAPDEAQTTLAHQAIDEGADLVVGAHPHVLQGIEQYNGKYIAYSLGNFCFGGNSNPGDMNTMIFQETFKVGQGGTVNETSINLIPCTVSSSTTWNNYQPTPAEGDTAQQILANIETMSAQLGTELNLVSTADTAVSETGAAAGTGTNQ